MSFPQTSKTGVSKLPLFVLMLAVYSESSVLPMIFLSVYGLIHGVAHVPRNRIRAVKSLLDYSVKVVQHGLGTSIQVTNS